MVQINDDYYEDLDPANFAKLLDDLRAGRRVRTGSQIGRNGSEPVGGLTSLTSLYGADGHGGPDSALAAPANDERRGAVTPPVVAQPPAPAPVPPPPAAPAADAAAAEAHAAAEEAHIKAKLASLPKDASAEQKANAVGQRPAGLAAARDGKADDLQRVKGIGPVNEKRLHDLGMFHYRQIAAWTRDEIRWVGTYLSFPGRIDREQWVKQSANLAAGGASLKDAAAPPPANS
jgi:NADH-quinone oxidoreductase subunit E